MELVEIPVVVRDDHHCSAGPHQFGQKLVIEFAPEFRILFRRPLIQQEDWALLEQAHNKRKAPALPAREVECTELPFCQAGFCIQPESAGYSPESTRKNVDLPEPLPPVMKTSSPGCRLKSIGPILNVASENLST